jgi:L-lactate dehydrogenase complex protein LldE
VRVSLFVTCLGDTLFPDTGRATVALLERLGVGVDFPCGQTCCGQMHINTGYAQQALGLVRRFVETFAESELIVAPSASCVATVRAEYPRLAEEAGDPVLATAVAETVNRTCELTELLVDRLGVTDVGAVFPHAVTYHPTCHSLRTLGLGDRPRALLGAVQGLELRELARAAECCGFGGTFAVKNTAVSAAMGADKARNITATGAEAVCTVDNSCQMHIGGTLARQGSTVRPVHIAEILASTEGDVW